MVGRERSFCYQNLYMTVFSEKDCNIQITVTSRAIRSDHIELDLYKAQDKKQDAQALNMKAHIADFSFHRKGNFQSKMLQVDSLVKKLANEVDCKNTCRELIKNIKSRRRKQCLFTDQGKEPEDYEIENRR